MNRVGLFSIILSCLSIPMKGFSIEKSVEREIDIFGAKLSPEEFRLENSKYAKQLKYRLANPCENFGEYICGDSANNSTKFSFPDIDTIYMEGVLSLSEALTKNLDGYENYEPVTALDKYKMYYSSCVYQNKDKTTYFEDILKVLEPYGGVPFWNKNWKSDNFDWMKFSAFAMRFNIPTFFNVFHESLSGEIVEHIIKISDIRNYTDWESNEEYMIKILKSMGSEAATETAMEIISFKKAVRGIGSHEAESMTLEELIMKYPQINWKSYFSIVFEKNEADLDLLEVIEVENDLIPKVLELISNAKPEIIANYMGWEFLEAVITLGNDPYFSKFENLLSPEYDHGGYYKNPKKYFKTACFKELTIFFLPVLSSLFFNEYYDRSSEEDAIKIGYETKSILQNLLETNSWIANKTDFEHLNSMDFKIDRPKVLSTTELNEFYSDLKITPKKYIENWFNLRKFETMRLYREKRRSMHWLSPLKFYDQRNLQMIQIPLLILLLQPFNRHLPEGSKFGFLGFGFAHNLLNSNPNYPARDFDVWTKAQELWICYKNEFNIVHSDYDSSLADLIALKSTLEAFKSRMNNLNQSRDTKLAEYDLTENQLFFIESSKPICSLSDKSRKQRLAFLANMNEFTEAFSCPLGSPMNPTKKCQIGF